MAASFADMIATDLAPQLRHQPWSTPGEMARALDRTTVQTPALQLIDQHLAQVANGECERLIISMPPQEGKSERASRRFPLWLLHRNPNLRIAIVSYGHDVAKRWGRRIRDDLRAHSELGLQLASSSQRQDEFELLGYSGGLVCVGVEGSLTSRPVDVLIIDDPYKDAKQADSKAWKQTVEDFWREVALPRLAPGAPVVLIQTRWRTDDMAGWLQREGDNWVVLNIPAQADHDPESGEPDTLGRAPGEYMESARRRTAADWEKKKREVGTRSWNALYQGRPTPSEGAIILRSWWQFYTEPQWVVRPDGSRWTLGFDEVLMSWDLTFKDTQASDYVVGQVWARRGSESFLLDQVRGRWSFVETMHQFRALVARWPQALLKLVEDKANGPAVISALNQEIPGIVPEEPQGSKEARLSAVSPLVESRSVWLPDPALAPWVQDVIEEVAAFPNGAHDDICDTLSQALNRLILQPLLSGEDWLSEDDLDPELDGFAISPY